MERGHVSLPAIPLCLVTGFLGSGKTSFLAHLARQYTARGGGAPVAFLINEFSTTDADSPQLAPLTEITLGVTGGSIFCRCKVTEFIAQLGLLAKRQPTPAGIVVEASGMADPSAARRMLAESGLDQVYAWRGCVALADPGSLSKVIDTLASAERQIACADVVLLNKCDLYGEAELLATESLIRAINPEAGIQRTVLGKSELDPLTLETDRWCNGDLSPCRDPDVVAVEAILSRKIDPESIASGLAGLGEGLLRAKGFLPTARGWSMVDWAGGRLHWRDGIAGPPKLVILVRQACAPAARGLAVRLGMQA